MPEAICSSSNNVVDTPDPITHSLWKWHTQLYQVSSLWVLPLASLGSEESLKLFDVVQTICGHHGNMKLSCKWCNMHAYQVSSPCVLPLPSLRRSGWRYLVIIETCSCHENDVIRICTKFHLHAFCSTFSEFEKWRRKFPEAICCCGHHGNDVIHVLSKFHLHACYS